MLSEVQKFTLNVVGTYILEKKINRLIIRLPYNIKEDKESDKIMCVNKRRFEFRFIVCTINFAKI